MARRLAHMLVSAVRWPFRQEIGLIVAVCMVALAVMVFARLADEMLEGEADAIDRRILLALRTEGDLARPIGPAWLVTTAEELTALGSTSVLVLLLAAVVGYLWLRSTHRVAW